MTIIGIDTGGTFTDFVVAGDDGVMMHKELSTPDAPERAIVRGLSALGIDLAPARIVHGSTVATNALLERRGARTVFVTNGGFRDLLTIGRQARAALYDLTPPVPRPPVPRELCLEGGTRLAADGSVISRAAAAELAALGERLAALEPEAIAVNLLFSWLDPEIEAAIAAVAPPGCFVSLSSEVLPEAGEYERGIATWLNACIGPVMRGYLERLTAQVAPARLSVMQSSGVTAAPEFAAGRAVNLLLSGPAGGLIGARAIGRAAGRERLLSFDMGGTSTDVALIDGDIGLTSEGRIDSWPVAVPMVDMHTIGAGGGSIASVDAGGVLQVGPRSAGAAPGPACYGAGGIEATVTDANVVLGRLPAGLALGGALTIDGAAASAALTRLGGALGVSAEVVARGVIDVANEHMAQALRVISVERGVDPRDYTLLSFGGAGGLHVCALAAALGMRRAMVPAAAGVLSAYGMVVATPGRRLSRAARRPLAGPGALDAAAFDAAFDAVAAPGFAALAQEGFERSRITAARSVDLRYRGQSFALNVAWRDADDAARAFHDEHERRYGHRLSLPVELVNLRVALDVAGSAPPTLPAHAAANPNVPDGVTAAAPVVPRAALEPDQDVAGPLVVIDDVGTCFVEDGWTAGCDGAGNLLLTMG